MTRSEIRATLAYELRAAGALPSVEVADYEDMFDGRATPASINAFVADLRDHHPTYFLPAGDATTALERRAFGEGDLDAQRRYARLYGHEMAEAAATRWNTKLGSSQRGVPPADVMIADAANRMIIDHGNPWAPTPINLDASGRYSATALRSQAAYCRALPLHVVQSIANKYAYLGATRPRAVA